MDTTKQRVESLETREIGIAGMTCDHCVRRVEKALRGVSVTFDRAQTDIPALHDALLKSGYKPAAASA